MKRLNISTTRRNLSLCREETTRAETILAAAITVAAVTPTQSQSGCHPSYDPCVPIASDVDCAGGRGNGPVYVRGPIRVIGPDVYGLDRDGDGVACER
ncbi:excalibur calcium-binding domain-containing protein [uncultured Roseibium sp.]|uniref:excalibur calcium-binding domain-containing protein n=1 Tax=uncultured Roseibium sp. TaxID=1936171 RepID=UPI0034525546